MARFADTDEVLSGYYLIDVADDEIAPRVRSAPETDLLATLRQSRRQRMALDVRTELGDAHANVEEEASRV
jgi:hypothetical protein